MSVIAVGVDQDHAPLDLLERVSLAGPALEKALARLRDESNLGEVVIVSTCLRTEVYAVVERFHDGVDGLQGFLADLAQTPVAALADHVTVHFDSDVARHLFSVAAGLDSAVLGESEVLGQVRRAWELARQEESAGPVLGALFRHAVETGKRVRSETAIARGITSLSHGAVALAADRRGGLDGAHVLVVGAGEMGSGVATALGGRGADTLVLANRSVGRTDAVLADLPDGVAATVRTEPLAGLEDLVAAADVVFTTVATTLPIVDRALLTRAVAARRRPGPLLVVDLGVPRNVEPVGDDLDGLVLLDMDDLRVAVGEALAGRREEAVAATAIVAEEVERYRAAARARDVAPVVAALRSRVEALRRSEFDRQRAKRSDLTADQWDQVDAVTRAMVASLLHDPTVTLKDAAGTPRGERLVESLQSLFDL